MAFRSDRLSATYLIETPYPIDKAVEVLAGEQSTGTFVRLPGETERIRQLHRATVEKIRELDTTSTPALPGAKVPDGLQNVSYRRAEVTISFPVHNCGFSISNLLATVAGNLFELQEFSGLRLLDIDIPPSFSEYYPGPQFGVDGTRRLSNVYQRPIIGTIIKPSVGLNADELRLLVRTLALAGLDFVKDDELNANPPYFPLRERVKAVMEEIERASQITGKKMMYAFNITDDIDKLQENHDIVVNGGGNCVMVSINSIGLAGVAYLRRYAVVPIHGHRNQWGAMTRSPFLGFDFRAYQKLCRLAGVDHLHTNGINNKFFESNDSVVKSVKDCLEPMLGGFHVMPVLSSGQWAACAIESYQSMNTLDVMHLAGGGIMAHPGGVEAGVMSMRQGWEAAIGGYSLEEYASNHPELRQAIEKFR